MSTVRTSLRDYRAYGLRVRSAIPLPFDPLAEKADAEPDVTVRLGAVPAELPDGPGNVTRTAFWQARPGAFRMEVGEVARYLVTGGRDVFVEPLGGSEDDVAVFFASSPFTALLQQRGVLTLHAASVQTTAGAVLLLGASGTGKSSLAAALAERGFPLLADNVTGVVPGGRPMALPAFSRHRLWAHTLDEMGWRDRAQRRVRADVEKDKYWLPAQLAATEPLPVCAAFVLAEGDHFGLEPVPPDRALWLLCSYTHRRRVMAALGQRRAHFQAAIALARRVPVARVTRPSQPFLLDELADRVAARLQGAPAGGASVAVPETPPAAVSRSPTPAASRPAESGTSGPGILWIAAWPKSGTTWLRAVLTSYLREDGGPPPINALLGGSANHREAFEEYLGLESSDMTDAEIQRCLPRFREVLADGLSADRQRNEPIFVKAHEAYRLPGGAPLFPRAGTVGVVYLVRNPLDVAVSYAHHLNWPIDRTIRLMADPAAHETRRPGGIFDRLPEPLSTWSGHVESWTQQTALRLHVARYEDLLANPHAGFGAILRFAGIELEHGRLSRAIEHTAFHRLQVQEAESGYAEKQPTASSFFRAGVAGAWRTALTAAQVQALTAAHGDVMARFRYSAAS